MATKKIMPNHLTPLDNENTPTAESSPDSDAGVDAEQIVRRVYSACRAIDDELRKRIIGQDEVVRLMLISLFARGHCLLVGVPGLAKTLLVQSLSETLRLQYKRIQFTPDLMPSDITGTDILEDDPATGKRSFRFIRGPIFTHLLLADEINRTPPKTQAALLQAMQEYEVTAAGLTHPVDPPFVVFATQNPIEQEGTYPLPEAQLDRFMFSADVGYPTHDDEVRIIQATTKGDWEQLNPVLGPEDIVEIQNLVYQVPAAEHVIRYAVRLVQHTRPTFEDTDEFVRSYVSWGAGPRASQHLILGGKALALIQGRYAVGCDDIRALVKPVLQHRIVTNFRAEAEQITTDHIIQHLLTNVRE
jgi:MoxR-like ATPase